MVLAKRAFGTGADLAAGVQICGLVIRATRCWAARVELTWLDEPDPSKSPDSTADSGQKVAVALAVRPVPPHWQWVLLPSEAGFLSSRRMRPPAKYPFKQCNRFMFVGQLPFGFIARAIAPQCGDGEEVVFPDCLLCFGDERACDLWRYRQSRPEARSWGTTGSFETTDISSYV